MDGSIVVDGLGKRYRRYHPERPTTLVESVVRGFGRLRATDRFWALRGVSFAVAPGRMVGVIGANGAGKSTLLQLVGGVVRPDEGRVSRRGRIGALLELGAGFHPELTGRENAYVTGVITGLTRREIDQRFDSIVDFAELADFIDSPLRTYSSGMRLRLAFAVAIHSHPGILLVDEVLAVGDIAFQRKCLARVAQFKAAGCAILLVSHELPLVEELCDAVVWLDHGTMRDAGATDEVVAHYRRVMLAG